MALQRGQEKELGLLEAAHPIPLLGLGSIPLLKGSVGEAVLGCMAQCADSHFRLLFLQIAGHRSRAVSQPRSQLQFCQVETSRAGILV